MSVTASKRTARPVHYLAKDKRTKIYRALYGQANSPDPQGRPEMNEGRRLPEHFNYIDVENMFHSLASKSDPKGLVVSNGLFNPQQYQALLRRLDTLRKFKPKRADNG